MRKPVVSTLIMVAVLFLAISAAADFVGQTNEQVKAVATPILENLMVGFNQGKYDQYSRDFDDTMREAINKKKFQQVRSQLLKKLGKYKDKEYLGFLNQKRYTIVLWKGKFSETKNDILIKLVLSKRQDKIMVVGLWFQ